MHLVRKGLVGLWEDKEAEREALQLTGMHLKRLEKEDPDNSAWKPGEARAL